MNTSSIYDFIGTDFTERSEFIKGVINEIPPKANFNKDNIHDVKTLIFATFEATTNPQYGSMYNCNIKGLPTGYGHWLDWVLFAFKNYIENQIIYKKEEGYILYGALHGFLPDLRRNIFYGDNQDHIPLIIEQFRTIPFYEKRVKNQKDTLKKEMYAFVSPNTEYIEATHLTKNQKYRWEEILKKTDINIEKWDYDKHSTGANKLTDKGVN